MRPTEMSLEELNDPDQVRSSNVKIFIELWFKFFTQHAFMASEDLENRTQVGWSTYSPHLLSLYCHILCQTLSQHCEKNCALVMQCVDCYSGLTVCVCLSLFRAGGGEDEHGRKSSRFEVSTDGRPRERHPPVSQHPQTTRKKRYRHNRAADTGLWDGYV